MTYSDWIYEDQNDVFWEVVAILCNYQYSASDYHAIHFGVKQLVEQSDSFSYIFQGDECVEFTICKEPGTSVFEYTVGGDSDVLEKIKTVNLVLGHLRATGHWH